MKQLERCYFVLASVQFEHFCMAMVMVELEGVVKCKPSNSSGGG